MSQPDPYFMQAACQDARHGINKRDGGPFGAAIVCKGVLIAVAHNTVLLCKDCTNHAEMNCIRKAAKHLGTHDLSDCDLYTTCEPCPMCWGACNWARIRRLFIGVTRVTAAKFGFDDEYLYQELNLPQNERSVKQMFGVLREDVKKVCEQTPTYRRRMLSGGGMMAKLYEQMFTNSETENDVVESVKLQLENIKSGQPVSPVGSPAPNARHENFMQSAIDIAIEGMSYGKSKEREPFGAVVVKEGKIISAAYNTVLYDHDPTATAEINALRKACIELETYSLSGCEIYTTVEPDPMSLAAIYWSRISEIHVGISQKFAAIFGFEEGLLQYKELQELKSDRDHRVVEIIDAVQSDECEKVFEEWKSLEGTLY